MNQPGLSMCMLAAFALPARQRDPRMEQLQDAVDPMAGIIRSRVLLEAVQGADVEKVDFPP